MRLVPESDVGVAMAAGGLLVALMVGALAVVAVATPADVGQRELAGFAIGFGLFAAIYFGSMRADAILTGDRYEPGGSSDVAGSGTTDEPGEAADDGRDDHQ